MAKGGNRKGVGEIQGLLDFPTRREGQENELAGHVAELVTEGR